MFNLRYLVLKQNFFLKKSGKWLKKKNNNINNKTSNKLIKFIFNIKNKNYLSYIKIFKSFIFLTDFFYDNLLFYKFINIFMKKGLKNKITIIIYKLFQILRFNYHRDILYFFNKLLFLFKIPFITILRKNFGKKIYSPKILPMKYQYNLFFILFKKHLQYKRQKNFFDRLLLEFFEYFNFFELNFIKYLKIMLQNAVKNKNKIHFKKHWY